MKDKDDFMPNHEPGKGRLKALLTRLDEDQDKLFKNPLYVEGYDDGFEIGRKEAERRAQHIISGIIRMYDGA
jgi:hypothetical protein